MVVCYLALDHVFTYAPPSPPPPPGPFWTAMIIRPSVKSGRCLYLLR